jgi:hypothetical protein
MAASQAGTQKVPPALGGWGPLRSCRGRKLVASRAVVNRLAVLIHLRRIRRRKSIRGEAGSLLPTAGDRLQLNQEIQATSSTGQARPRYSTVIPFSWQAAQRP